MKNRTKIFLSFLLPFLCVINVQSQEILYKFGHEIYEFNDAFNDLVYDNEKLFTGEVIYVEYYSIIGKSTYKDGKRNGLTEVYHKKNDKLKEKILFENGLKHGLSEFYNDDGQLQYKAVFINGLVEECPSELNYDSDIFELNGQLVSNINSELDKVSGLLVVYNSDGKIKLKVIYEEGKKVGNEEFFCDGILNYIVRSEERRVG